MQCEKFEKMSPHEQYQFGKSRDLCLNCLKNSFVMFVDLRVTAKIVQKDIAPCYIRKKNNLRLIKQQQRQQFTRSQFW